MPFNRHHSKLIQTKLENLGSSRSSTHRFLGIPLRWYGLVIKLMLSLAVFWFIYERVIRANQTLNLQALLTQVLAFRPALVVVGFISLLLMVANWSIEVVKWRMLMRTQFEIRWTTSIKGVLSGVSVGVFSANRMGEFIGRVLAIPPGWRFKAALLSFVNGVAQTTATFTFGVLGLFFLLSVFGEASLGIAGNLIMRFTLLVTLLLLVFLYFKIPLLAPSLSRIRYLSRWKDKLEVFGDVDTRILRNLYNLSLLRFVTFLGQYMVLFYIVYDQPDWAPLTGASVLTLFSTTLIPFLPVPDLLLRETFALGFFDLFAFDAIRVSIVVFGVWLINVAVPAVLGAITLFTYRIFKRVS